MNTKIANWIISTISFAGTIIGIVQATFLTPKQEKLQIIISVSIAVIFALIFIFFYFTKKKYVDLYSVCSSMACNNRLQSLREFILIRHRAAHGNDNRYRIKKAKLNYTIFPSKEIPNCYDIHYTIAFKLLKPWYIPWFMMKSTKNRTLRFFIITLAAYPQNLVARIFTEKSLPNDNNILTTECTKKNSTVRGESGSNEKTYSGLYEIISVIPKDIAKNRQIEITFTYDIVGQIKAEQNKHSFTIVPSNYSRKIHELEVNVQFGNMIIDNLEFQRYGIDGEFEIAELFVPCESKSSSDFDYIPAPVGVTIKDIHRYYTSIVPMMNSVYSVQFDLPKPKQIISKNSLDDKTIVYNFRKATVEDIPLLIKCRMDLLHSAIKDGNESKWGFVEEQVKQYYKKAIPEGTHIAYLAFNGDTCVGTGGVCFYQILPTYFKPTGKKAYIINMYTEESYRKKGIATHILELLIQESLAQGATYISLEATDAGRPLYEKLGFATLHSEMQYMNETYEGPKS